MKQITFENIFTLGNVVEDNKQYRHFHYPEMLVRHDSNFIEFKSLPSLVEFKKIEAYLRDFHLERNQQHLKFYFPENVKLSEELTTYLTKTGYDIGFLELYAIQPSQFPSVKNNSDIEVQFVTESTLETLIELKYKNDLEYGIEFAKQKTNLIKRQFDEQNIRQVIAFYKGVPVGHVDVIVSLETVEIDELMVDEAFQKKGIGSRLQKFVMDTFPEKTVILVADGEDTPKEMYKKQNYEYLGFQYEVQKAD